MKKLILIATLSINLFNSNAQSQLGVVTVSKQDKTVPVGFWYVMDDKNSKHQMFFYDKTENVMKTLTAMLDEYDQNFNAPFGKDTEGDDYWIITHPTGNIVYLYFVTEPGAEYSFITSVTR